MKDIIIIIKICLLCCLQALLIWSPMEQAKYTGVRKRKWGKWVSEIRLPNSRERIWLGSYNAPEKAARAFDVAQYCLRGPTARFNFPDDPPDVPGGRWLSPAEIQGIAASSGNDYRLKPLPENDGDGVRGTGTDDDDTTHVVEINDTSTSSAPGGGAQLEGIDWSFLDNLDAPFTSNDYFGLFHGDVYVPPNDYEIEYGDDGESIGHFSQQSFLWNF
ncbi:PREDICTED: ethylene-responsive transcription factor ERF017-like [Ipomoea nil]|uniref:ethylene-responsive transcription factor ERF017-like n=1 Tax=Ipomoea nil TaxID=35883 RepID=UPI000900E6D9|nr:PREDICTED: ethylene-responsive transcription factor ERF017-like [Ipomoea nil]